MSTDNDASAQTTGGPMVPNAAPGNRSGLEGSMSYAMITIGSGVGHLAASIFSAVARGLRFLPAQARGSERRSRASYGRQGLAGSQWKSHGV